MMDYFYNFLSVKRSPRLNVTLPDVFIWSLFGIQAHYIVTFEKTNKTESLLTK